MGSAASIYKQPAFPYIIIQGFLLYEKPQDGNGGEIVPSYTLPISSRHRPQTVQVNGLASPKALMYYPTHIRHRKRSTTRIFILVLPPMGQSTCSPLSHVLTLSYEHPDAPLFSCHG